MSAVHQGRQSGGPTALQKRQGIPGRHPRLEKAGYPIKSTFGLKGSEVAKISPKQLNRMRDNVYIIDIRPEHDYSYGYIPESRAIPLGFLSLFREEIPKNEKIVIIDVVGNQAPTACKYLVSEGYTDVSWVVGGFRAWAKQGYEVVK